MTDDNQDDVQPQPLQFEDGIVGYDVEGKPVYGRKIARNHNSNRSTLGGTKSYTGRDGGHG